VKVWQSKRLGCVSVSPVEYVVYHTLLNSLNLLSCYFSVQVDSYAGCIATPSASVQVSTRRQILWLIRIWFEHDVAIRISKHALHIVEFTKNEHDDAPTFGNIKPCQGDVGKNTLTAVSRSLTDPVHDALILHLVEVRATLAGNSGDFNLE
jgi:hypothetical protein